MHRVVLNFLKDESGATAIEYSLMIALVAVVVISALDLAGGALAGVFQNVSLELDVAAAAPGSGTEGTGSGSSDPGASGAGGAAGDGAGDDLSDGSGARDDDSGHDD